VRKLGVPEHEELARRFPTWMWRNADVLDFVGWLRDFNESRARRSRLRKTSVNCSMSGSGDCRNNAVVESFNGTIKRELINWNRWETRSAATMAIAEYIEGWYNLRRRHSEARVRSAPCSMSCEA
jgi:erythromycin esterase-like protein